MPVSDPFKNRFHPCTHVHKSGRRCSVRVPKSSAFCQNHFGKCLECESMLQAFQPPKGW